VKPDISILVPTRGRPEKIARLLASIGQHDNVEVIVGVDDDDPDMQYAEPWAIAPYHRVVTGPRHNTLGALFNTMAAQAHGDWLMAMGDDYVLETADWPAILLECGKRLPLSMGVMFARDPHHPNFPTIFCINRVVYDLAGYFVPPFFPYWFVDTWWDEISVMTGLRLEMPIDVALPDGRGETQGMRDLKFWVKVFERTRSMRVRVARDILGYSVPPDRRALVEARVAHLSDPVFRAKWGRSDGTPPSERYLAAKLTAERLLRVMNGAKK